MIVPDTSSAGRLLLLEEVSALVRLSPVTIGRLRRRGEFPEPLALGARRLAWRAGDVESYLAGLPQVSSERAHQPAGCSDE